MISWNAATIVRTPDSGAAADAARRGTREARRACAQHRRRRCGARVAVAPSAEQHRAAARRVRCARRARRHRRRRALLGRQHARRRSADEHMRRVRGRVEVFQKRVGEIEGAGAELRRGDQRSSTARPSCSRTTLFEAQEEEERASARMDHRARDRRRFRSRRVDHAVDARRRGRPALPQVARARAAASACCSR